MNGWKFGLLEIWMPEVWVPINSNPQRTCTPHSLRFLSACLTSPITKVAKSYYKHIPMFTDHKYHLPMSVIHQKNSNPLVIARFKGFHDLLNYIKVKGGVKCHTNRESPCSLKCNTGQSSYKLS